MATSSPAPFQADRNEPSTARPLPACARPVGHSFEVPELLMLLAWAEFHNLRVLVELDHCIDGEEYEEVVALYPPGSPLRQWTMWRAADAIVVEPMNARAFRLPTISDVLQTLVPTAG